MKEPNPHRYVGRSDGWCKVCGEPMKAVCHQTQHRFGLDHEPENQPDPTISTAVDMHADVPINKDDDKEWVCADCGREYDEGNLCRYCGSVRVVLKSVVEELFGPDWRKAFE